MAEKSEEMLRNLLSTPEGQALWQKLRTGPVEAAMKAGDLQKAQALLSQDPDLKTLLEQWRHYGRHE